MPGVFLNQGDRTSKVQCKGYVDGTQLKNGGYPTPKNQIIKSPGNS
jgi:hypothetical protein